MKFVKCISLFFIYPLSMFSLGFASNMAIMEFFYPGESVQAAPPEEALSAREEDVGDMMEPLEVSMSEEPVISADTRYVIQEYNAMNGQLLEETGAAPDMYIGLKREDLAQEVSEYNQNPSLSDLEEGFVFMELVSFSPKRVVVRKSYEPLDKDRGFFLLNENHYVVVYDYSLSHIYMTTDILVENLPVKLQEEILRMKFIENEGDLYNFLESYSS